MVLAEYTAQITPREEDRSAPVEALNTGFFAAVGSDHVDFCGLGADETDPGFFEAVYGP